MTDPAGILMLLPEPYPVPGEQVLYSPKQGAKCFFCTFPPGLARLYATSARLAAFRSVGATSEMTILGMASGSLDEYASTIELDEIANLDVWEGADFRSLLSLGGHAGRVELYLRDGTTRRIQCDEPAEFAAFVEALRKGLASPMPLTSFSDASEAVRYKGSGRAVSPFTDPLEGLCRDVFAFGSRMFAAPTRLCITNKRILLYRVECLQSPPKAMGNMITVDYGRPTAKWVQLTALEDVTRVQVKRTFFPLGQVLMLTIRRRGPFGCIPLKPSLTMHSEEEVFAPTRPVKLVTDDALDARMRRQGSLELMLTGTSPLAPEQREPYEKILRVLQELLPGVVRP